MDDIDAMFSDMLQEMDLLTQSLGAEAEAAPLPKPPSVPEPLEINFSIGFSSLNESLNDLEDNDLDALMADLVADINATEEMFATEKETLKGSLPAAPSPSPPQSSYVVEVSKPATSSNSAAAPPLLTGSKSSTEDDEEQLKADKIKLALEKIKEAKVKKLVVKVEIKDGSSKTLMVDERQTVRDVMDNLFEKTHCDCNVDWSVCETNPDLQTERGFEDHENLVEPLSTWTRDTENKVLFLERKDKYEVFKNPQASIQMIFYLWKKDKKSLKDMKDKDKEQLLKENFCGASVIVPDLEGVLFLKEDGKKSWKQRFFLLRASGLYYSPKGKTKHPQIQKESQYIKYLCCDDADSMTLWVTGIRVAKYGKQLFDNYKDAVRKASGSSSWASRSIQMSSSASTPSPPLKVKAANGEAPQPPMENKVPPSQASFPPPPTDLLPPPPPDPIFPPPAPALPTMTKPNRFPPPPKFIQSSFPPPPTDDLPPPPPPPEELDLPPDFLPPPPPSFAAFPEEHPPPSNPIACLPPQPLHPVPPMSSGGAPPPPPPPPPPATAASRSSANTGSVRKIGPPPPRRTTPVQMAPSGGDLMKLKLSCLASGSLSILLMAEANVLLDQEFGCSICLELLKDPVTTSCGHSFCKICIEDCWNEEDVKGAYSCPQCRQTFISRPSLAKNVLLAEMLEKLKKSSTQTDDCYAGAGDVECDSCTGRKHKAVKSCLVCLNSYCRSHLQQHESLFSSKHKLIEATGQMREMMCSKHEEQLKMFCRTDQKCVCFLCVIEEHKNHETVTAATEKAEKQIILKELQKEYDKKIKVREKELQELMEAVVLHKCSTQAAVRFTERIFTDLIRSIEKRSSELTQLIRDQEKAAANRAEVLVKRLEKEIDGLKSKSNELERLSQVLLDPIVFLQRFPTACVPPGATDMSSFTISSLLSLDHVEKSVFELKETLENICKEEVENVTEQGKLFSKEH
ncbi:hypothetical protein DNTS_004931 [Danionella cerebrum]|uniref:RING-type E3 ubiquitin transferase n=1 Tax=Danionella cerebrum TaxID=2873325 RepID=A0A553MZC7_9TELE|nr:hypothetical protein DNTS_004931 [Danionella translucida]